MNPNQFGLVEPDNAGTGKPLGEDEGTEGIKGGISIGEGLIIGAAGAIFTVTGRLVYKKAAIVAVKYGIGHNVPTAIYGFGVTTLIGPVEELFEWGFGQVLNDRRPVKPDRPFIDLQGPARFLIDTLSFIPGETGRAAARQTAKILERDLQPKVEELKTKVFFNTVLPIGPDSLREQRLKDRAIEGMRLIRSGANPDEVGTQLGLIYEALKKIEQNKVINSVYKGGDGADAATVKPWAADP